ncbi:MAG TPA: copper resistance CopC family protein [Lapillicoccus sp.]
MYAGKERRNRAVALVLAVVLVAGVFLALLATVVQAASAQASPVSGVHAALPAHATLVSVTPADGAELSSGPSQIQLTFDDVISPQLAQVRLTRDGSPVETTAPRVDRTVVTVDVTGRTGPGAYRLVWQVTSDDGHPVSGASAFSVAGAAGQPTPRVTPSYKTPQTQPTTFGHPDHLPGLIVAGVLLLCGIGLLVYEHRRRARQPDSDAGHKPDSQDRQRIS